MNKQELMDQYKLLVNELGEHPHHVVLSAGGALVMMGLREKTDDLDVDIQPSVFKWAALGRNVITEENVSPRVKYKENIDLHELSETTAVVCIDGVWVYSPGEMIIQKRHLATLPNRAFGKRERDLIELTQLESLQRNSRLCARMA